MRMPTPCVNFDVDALPPTFADHAVVRRHDRVAPVGYFSDGVPHTRKDSFFAHYFTNILTGRRLAGATKCTTC
eukprot:4171591-Pyramimonas_sp.AAC.1